MKFEKPNKEVKEARCGSKLPSLPSLTPLTPI